MAEKIRLKNTHIYIFECVCVCACVHGGQRFQLKAECGTSELFFL
jgi:hypothetical protein